MRGEKDERSDDGLALCSRKIWLLWLNKSRADWEFLATVFVSALLQSIFLGI